MTRKLLWATRSGEEVPAKVAQRRGRHAASGGVARFGALSGRCVVALLSATVLVGTGTSWATLGSLERGSNSTDVLDAAPQERVRQGGDGAIDVLLVGNDSRTDAQGNPLPLDVLKTLRTEQSVGTNTDTIIVVRIPDNGRAAHAVSIPRDTYVQIPGTGKSDKINSVYGSRQTAVAEGLRDSGFHEDQIEREATQGGRRALVNTVEQLTGVRIDHYAEINLYGFYLLTEAIGGV
ncbi:MAG TPA: LCP family protein, partial [Pseudonocardiaceae bacterium]|nr:LCP family protein [Pseudonocardiaceae bacterium]